MDDEMDELSSYKTTWKQRCGQCSFWIKYIIFVINFFVWVCGVSLVIIGAWARLQKAEFGSIDNLSTDPAFFLLLLGFLTIVISSFGCFGALRENICLLKTFSLSIVVMFLLEVVGGILTFVFLDQFQNHLISYMRKAIVIYQDDKDLKNGLDFIQKSFSCCGALSYNDWELNMYHNCSSPSHFSCGVPSSCCKLQIGTMAASVNAQCGFRSRIEGDIYASHSIHIKGCIEPLMNLLKENMLVIGILAFTVGFVELVSIILAHLLMRMLLQFHPPIREEITLSHLNQ
ncbi:hypothetical protein CAPTEDRAFT_159744 [Capitella teleta]|uniref:Tetraspanin n=1 Tax=Capitella teleta TaxID=283909 RepID=R7UMV2_CAPTE|nr:hypothetical protein CAPTEDRAFT_159744 [Capitella teleta]|eukprot:ELU05262.1 hypothetical protein CAPTEDRAFT_159744 [Capitella teleta]